MQTYTENQIMRMEPAAGQISLLIAPGAISAVLLEMIAELTFKSRVIILDGGNRFDGYGLARALRRRTEALDDALQRVLLSRVFTCYQMLTLLSELPQQKEPLIVLDMLSTFLDENVALRTRRDLLAGCLLQLERLSQSAPAVIWARKRSIPGVEDEDLLALLLEAAHRDWHFEKPLPEAKQQALF